ncbi:hypothetical protein ACS0TY_010646 [Phlomoides rotata]
MSVFPIFFLLFITFGAGATHVDDCTPPKTRCRKPDIRFPFWFKGQPVHCGLPGFEVYCDENRDTLLDLPSSVTLKVKKIDYGAQELQLSDPKTCLPLKLPHLNLSASPFSFLANDITDLILFNCSSPNTDYDNPIPCLTDSTYKFYAVDYSVYMDSFSLTSCTRFHNVSRVPQGVFRQKVLHLYWSNPECARCEAQGQGCASGNHCVHRHIGHTKALKIATATLCSLAFVMTVGGVIIGCFLFIRMRENQKKVEKFLEDYRGLKSTRFCYSDIRRMTNEFSEKVGEGGYGVVYKGKLTSEISVAVKVLNNTKEKRGEEFVNEVSTMGRIHHVNVVRLVGFCAEGFRRVVVYEFLPNDSLEKFIFQTESKRSSLGWEKLLEIALGIAKGIEYLHQGCDQQILHFDIKPHNILLDENLIPKISDFGLAKLCSKEQSGVTMTAARGTMGYIAPEVLSRTFGKVSYKSDVYSFGMMLLEIVGGRKNVDTKVNTSQVYFPQWVFNHLNLGDELWSQAQNEEEDDDEGKIGIGKKLTIVGLCCIQWNPSDRPSMKDVVQMLEGDGSDLTMPPNPFPEGSVASLVERHFQAELPLILEIDE